MKAIANSTISLGLISVPVQVCQAIETANDVTFKQAGPNGEELRQAYLLPDGTECPKEEIQKGIFQSGLFFSIDPDDLNTISEVTKIEGLPIDEVVDAGELWSRAHRITGLYYIQCPKKNGNVNAFKLFVDALEKQGQIMVTKWTARSRQKQLVLWPKDGLLMASSVCFAGDVRSPDEGIRAHLAGTYTDAEMTMALNLLDAMAKLKSTALEMEVDDAVALKSKLVDDALAGTTVEAPKKPAVEVPQTTALADALTASLAALKAKEPVG